MAVGDVTHVAIDGTALSNTLTTKYTVPTGKTAIFLSLVFCNFDTVAREIELQIIEPGASAANARRVLAQSADTAIGAGESQRYVFENLIAATYIQVKIDSGTSVNMRGGVTLKQVA